MSNAHHVLLRTAVLCSVAFAPAARAQAPRAGSLLVFPEVDPAGVTLLTVTNTNSDAAQGAIQTRWVYVDGGTCTRTTRTVQLAANDTYTINASTVLQAGQRGYTYVYAESPTTGVAVSFNHLIGAALRLDAVQASAYEPAPAVFAAVPPTGAPTDVDGDGTCDFDGAEYEPLPDRVVLPRFLGQGSFATSHLVLLGLRALDPPGTTQVDFRVFNDQGVVLTSLESFACWARRPLTDYTALFSEAFLESIGNDPNEILGLPWESGWIELDGHPGTDPDGDTTEPPFLAFLVERIQGKAGAMATVGIGTQAGGSLAGTPPVPPVCTTDRAVRVWPVDRHLHSFRLADIAGVVDPGGLPVQLEATAITQDEPTGGPGPMLNRMRCDGLGVGRDTVWVRAEREAMGNGRVYVVSYLATNSAGLTCTGSVALFVPRHPHDEAPMDDGQLYDSTEFCP